MYNMDCMIDMPNVADKQFDIAICDIPYGIGVGRMAYLNETNTTVKQKNGNRLNPNKQKNTYTLKDWDKSTPPQKYFNELKRISREQIIFGIEYTDWKGVGKGRIIWDKGVPDGVSFSRYEIAYCSMIKYTKEIKLLWAGMQQAKSLKEPMTQQGNKKLNEKRIHPCHKPTMLYERILQLFATEGMNILDTHVGGGRLRIACHKMGMDFTGYEIDKEYFDKQEKSFNQYMSQYKLFKLY